MAELRSKPKGGHRIWLLIKMVNGASFDCTIENDLLNAQKEMLRKKLTVLLRRSNKHELKLKEIELDLSEVASVIIVGAIGSAWMLAK